MPETLTPLTEVTETLGAPAEVTETLALVAENTETLGFLGEIIRSSQYLWPGQVYPGTNYPGSYGLITGHAFGLLNETTESLAPLVEV